MGLQYTERQIKYLSRVYREPRECAEQALRIGAWEAETRHGADARPGHMFNYARKVMEQADPSKTRAKKAQYGAGLSFEEYKDEVNLGGGWHEVNARLEWEQLAAGMPEALRTLLWKYYGEETTGKALGAEYGVSRDTISDRVATGLNYLREKAGVVVPKKQTSASLPGAAWNKEHGRWTSTVQINGRRTFLGYFETEQEAHDAYTEAKKNAPKNR